MKQFMMIPFLLVGLYGCAATSNTKPVTDSPAPIEGAEWVDLSQRSQPAAITTAPWTDIVIGVPDLDDVPALFDVIGGFETQSRTDMTRVMRARGVDSGRLIFQKTAKNAAKTRPYGSQSWDTGCYFSVMMRAKDIPSIIDDAAKLGWAPLTEMAYLEFGPSQLNIVVLGHKKTGVQVQLYERLTTPLPKGFPDFERISRPFNMMQMVRSRDAAYNFYHQGLGFRNFYFGKPSVSQKPEVMPLGIPVNLTTSVPYHAGIVTPKVGLEWGRMETIQVDMTGGKDLSAQCKPGNIGITEVRFGVDDLNAVEAELAARDLSPKRKSSRVIVKTPDGANIAFYQK